MPWKLKAPSVTCAAISDYLVWEDYGLCSTAQLATSSQNLQQEKASTNILLSFAVKGQTAVMCGMKEWQRLHTVYHMGNKEKLPSVFEARVSAINGGVAGVATWGVSAV